MAKELAIQKTAINTGKNYSGLRLKYLISLKHLMVFFFFLLLCISP